MWNVLEERRNSDQDENSRERFEISKLSIRRLNLPYHESKAINLETIVTDGKTVKKLWVSRGSTIYEDISYRPMNL